MPLTAKGKEILSAMERTYHSKAEAEKVFYASANAGKITGVHDAAVKLDSDLRRIADSLEELNNRHLTR